MRVDLNSSLKRVIATYICESAYIYYCFISQ